MAVRALTADDVALYRSLRLRALTTDPDAFGSNHDRESAFDDATWIERMTGFAGRPGVVFVELDDATGDGLAIGGIGVTEDPTEAIVWGMWVTPEARGRGVARRLLDEALAWAAERELTTVRLAVVRSNRAARSLYESYGFEPILNDLPPSDPCADEVLMRRRV